LNEIINADYTVSTFIFLPASLSVHLNRFWKIWVLSASFTKTKWG